MRTIKMERAVNNNEWIENEEKPDPEVLPSLPGYHILVRPVSVKNKTKGGLLLPDSVKDDVAYLTTVGKVLAIGDLSYKDKDKFPNGKWCDVGDYVCYARHAGQKLYYKGVRLLLLFDDQIMMKVGDPKDLDTTYNLSN